MSMRTILSFSTLLSDSDRKILRDELQNNGQFHLVAEVSDYAKILSITNKYQPELLLLDVKLNGFEIAQKLLLGSQQACGPAPAFIFMGSDPLEALTAYEMQGSAYLLLPLKAPKLRITLQRLLTLNRLELKLVASRDSPLSKPCLSARTESAYLLVPHTEIYYLEATAQHTKIVHQNGEATTPQPLSRLLSLLGNEFMQIHRSYIVRIEYIGSLEAIDSRHQLIMREPRIKLPISRRKLGAVRKVFKSFG